MGRQQQKHWAIHNVELSMESSFVQNLLDGNAPEELHELKGKNGVLFSNYTLQQFIKEEAVHDKFVLSRQNQRSIRTFSSGEQRKALLEYLLAGQPDFLVLENAFDMLDKQAQADLLQRLTLLSDEIPILQVYKRKENLLPFVNFALRVENGKVTFSGSIDEFHRNFKEPKDYKLKQSIPPPILEFKAENNPLIEFKNVRVNYGTKTVVNNINWTIGNGEFWQLKGPNGSGKTTLLTMITGDNPKAYGQDLTLFGRKKGSGESIWDIKKKIGYVTPAMTVLFSGRHSTEEMVISGLTDSIGLYTRPSDLQRKLAEKWMELIGLNEFKSSPFSRLSESQQCMVLIARAMIKHPPLLILDEPTHGLDDYNVSILIALVNKFAKESQTALIYVSHRDEPGLKPQHIYELIPTGNGSTGKYTTNP